MLTSISSNSSERPLNIIKSEDNSTLNLKLSIHDKEGISFINLQDIVYCESDRSYTIVHLANGKRIVSTKTLKEFEKRLSPYSFFRIHSHSLINIHAVSRFLKEGGGQVVMSNGRSIYISRRKKAIFLDLICQL